MSNDARKHTEWGFDPVGSYLDFWSMDSEPRPQQVDVLTQFDRAGGRGVVLCDLPTGVGKSGIATTVAARDTGIILTPLKSLQDQYQRDWPWMPLLKGAANYQCKSRHGVSCEIGRAAKCQHLSCPYSLAKADFCLGTVSTTNYAYFFAAIRGKEFRDACTHKTLILDESHGLESALISAAEVVIGDEVRRLDGLTEEWPDNEDDAFAFVRALVSPLSVRVMRLFNMIERGSEDRKVHSEYTRLSNLLERIKYFAQCDPDEWIYTDTSFSDRHSFTLRPLTARGLYAELVAPLGKRVVMMSATMPAPKLMDRWLGISSAGALRISMPSPFPVANRKVYYAPVGHMNMSSVERTLPAMATQIERIISRYADSKGIIHSHSFKLTEKLSSLMRQNRRVTAHRRDSDREELIQRHLTASGPAVLMSPSMTEGLDLYDDLSRFTIIPKVPWPSLDNWVSARMKIDPEWYAWQTLKTIIQAVGRGIRHSDDFCDTFILDAGFQRLMDQWGHLVPKWFTDSIVW